jgi:hypothetical protein
MLTAIIVLALGTIAWGVIRDRARRAGDPDRAQRMQHALRRLAAENRLEFEQGGAGRADAVSGEKDGVRFRMEAGTRGLAFDGDVVVVTSCASDERLVVWPRDPPDAVVDGLGEERPTRDPVFDARFASFSSSAALARVTVDEEMRGSLYELGIVALVVREREALLLLPGVPSSESFEASTSLLTAVASRCERFASARA